MLLKEVDTTKKQLIIHFDEDKVISDEEQCRSIIIVELPFVEEKLLKDTLYETFSIYGKIERIILNNNSDNNSYDCVIVFDNQLSVEKSRLHPHPILNKEVVIIKASTLQTSYENKEGEDSASVNVMYSGIKAFSTLQQYDGGIIITKGIIFFVYFIEHYNLIQKVGGALETVGDMSMKIANKVDSSLNISDKLKPYMNTTPVKLISKAFSTIGDVTMNTYEKASSKYEKEQKLKEEIQKMKEKEENKNEDKKVEDIKEETKNTVKQDEKREVEKVEHTQETKMEMKCNKEEEKK